MLSANRLPQHRASRMRVSWSMRPSRAMRSGDDRASAPSSSSRSSSTVRGSTPLARRAASRCDASSAGTRIGVTHRLTPGRAAVGPQPAVGRWVGTGCIGAPGAWSALRRHVQLRRWRWGVPLSRPTLLRAGADRPAGASAPVAMVDGEQVAVAHRCATTVVVGERCSAPAEPSGPSNRVPSP